MQMDDHHRWQPGATLPPHALDHSGTPMPTSDYFCGPGAPGLAWFRASSTALANCPDVMGEGDTHFERYVGLHVCERHRYCQGGLCFEVGDGFDVLVHVQVASTKVPVCPALPRPVARLVCNCKALRVVLDCLAGVTLRLTRAPEAPVRPALPCPVPNLLAIARSCARYAMVFA